MTRRLAIVLAAACFALACGSQEDKMDRGLDVDPEMAVPGTPSEYDMTEAERKAKIAAEDSQKEAEEFDEEAAR